MALQNFIFPDGIHHDTKNETVLTPKANSLFELIAVLKRVLKDDTNDKGSTNAALSCLVGMVPITIGTTFPIAIGTQYDRVTLHPELLTTL